MANEFIGNPQTAGLVRRSKYLEDAIKGLQNTPQSVYDTPAGTWGSVLSKAILGFSANDAASKAEAAQKADNDRLTSAILGTPEQTAAADLGKDQAFDLTPKGFDNRVADTEATRLRAISEMGGPMAALHYQQGQAATKKEDDRWDKTFGFQQDRATAQDNQFDRTFQAGRDDAGRAADQWRMGYEQQGEQFGAKLNQDATQFDQTIGLSRDQFGEVKRHNLATEGIAADAAAAKAAAAGMKSPYTNTQQNDFIKKAQGVDAMQGALVTYKNLIEEAGPQLWTTGLGGDNPKAKMLQSAKTAVQMQAKNLFELGVLNGPDLGLIESVIPDVTGSNAIGKNPNTAFSQLSVIDGYLERGRSQIPTQFIELARPNGIPFKPYNDKQIAGATELLANWDTLSEAARATPKAKEAHALAQKIVASAKPQGATSTAPTPMRFKPGDTDIDEATGEEYIFMGGDPTDPDNWEPAE